MAVFDFPVLKNLALRLWKTGALPPLPHTLLWHA